MQEVNDIKTAPAAKMRTKVATRARSKSFWEIIAGDVVSWENIKHEARLTGSVRSMRDKDCNSRNSFKLGGGSVVVLHALVLLFGGRRGRIPLVVQSLSSRSALPRSSARSPDCRS